MSRYDIKTATGASYRKPTAEEIDRALHYLQLIRRLEGTSGNLSYYPVCMDYAEVAFGRTTMMMPVKTKKEVYVPQKLEEMLMQYSK